ncbi:MAG: hypothetical protein JXA93_19690, partial [Anaerolineae bacterium]|nr:hypothetical protein [Anaerolineae bacterium]
MGLLRIEVLQAVRLGLLRVAVVLLLFAALLRGVVWPPSSDFPQTGLWSFFPVVAVVVMATAVTVGQEFTGGTLRGLVTRGVARWHFVLVRFAALVVVGGLLLGTTEGIATWLGVRLALHPGE